MAKARFTSILTATEGLNNTVDPARLSYDLKSGVTELSQAVNVDIDKSGRSSRRLGRTLKNVNAAAHGFVHGEVCLFVSGTILYKMKPDYTVVALRSDLTENARMRYFPIADRIYYTNENEKGYILKGQDNVWEKGNYTAPEGSVSVYSDPPKCHIVGWFAGRLLVATGNTIFASEPSFYGVFDLFNNHRLVPNTITMLQPTTQGLWVGTSTQLIFYRGTKWEEVRREPKADYGVLEGSDVWCPGEKRGVGNRSLLITTPQGICACEEDGSFNNLTYNKLTFPSGRYASATMAGNRYLVLIEP